jgi:hypothetical protein
MLHTPLVQAGDAMLQMPLHITYRLHNDAIKKDPFIATALGPNAKLERMRVASLRVGGQVGLAVAAGVT